MAFKKDVGELVPLIGKVMENCAYNPMSNVAGFHVNEFRVVIGKSRMDVYGTDDEAKVNGILDLMIERLSENAAGERA